MYENLRLDFGCGRRKKPGWFGIDCQALEGVDLVCDCNLIIPLPDNCAIEANASDFLEHVQNDKRIHIMSEVWRLLKPGGIFTSCTPSTDGRGWACDPTHYSFWNELSFLYYSNDAHRRLYDIKPKFDIISLATSSHDPVGVCHVKAVLRCVK